MNYKEFLLHLANAYDSICDGERRSLCFLCFTLNFSMKYGDDETVIYNDFIKKTGVDIKHESMKEHVERLISVDVKRAVRSQDSSKDCIESIPNHRALSSTYIRDVTGSISEDPNALRRDWLRHIASLY